MENIKLLWSDMCLGELSTHKNDDAYDADTDDKHSIRRTIHDYKGSLVFTPNEPKI